MKAINAKRSLYVGLIGALALGFISIIPVARVSAASSPRVYTPTDVTSNSVVLPIKYDRFDDETVTAIVSVRDDSTGILVERAFKVSLDSKGNGSIMVGNLKSFTDYAFKVRLMSMTDDRESDNSDIRYEKTL